MPSAAHQSRERLYACSALVHVQCMCSASAVPSAAHQARECLLHQELARRRRRRRRDPCSDATAGGAQDGGKAGVARRRRREYGDGRVRGAE